VKASKAKQNFQGGVMKRSKFSTLFALGLVFASLTISNLAAAADTADPSPADHQQVASVAHRDSERSGDWELNLDRVNGVRLLRAQFVPATACYTFQGPVCPMAVTVPQGAPCTCYFVGYPPLPGTAW
jgi:hypothetical protein